MFLWKKPAPYLTSVRSRHRLRPRQPSPERCRRQLRCRWWRQVHRLHDGVGVVDFCFFPLKNPGIHEIFRKMQPLKWKTWIPAKNGWFFRCSFSFWKGDMYIAGFHVKNFGGVSLEHTPPTPQPAVTKKLKELQPHFGVQGDHGNMLQRYVGLVLDLSYSWSLIQSFSSVT